MTVQDIAALIERIAPLHWQEEYDNAGLQVGSPATEVTGILVSLDLTEAVIDEAVRRGCNLVVSHHPLIFRPLRQVCGLSWQQRCVEKALKAGVCLYSAHTNLDNAPDGVNRRIAEIIGLKGLRSLEEKADGSWSGAIGTLREIVERKDFLRMLRERFGAAGLQYCGEDGTPVRRVALCGGAGNFLLDTAKEKGADCFITGELRYHDWFEAEGMLLVQLGHYESECCTEQLLCDILLGAYPQLKVLRSAAPTNPVRYCCAA